METVTGLLQNKWVLYGGAAIAVLAGIYMFSGSGEAAADDSGGFFPSSLMPINAGGGYQDPSQLTAAGGDGTSLDALIGLENSKTVSNEKISLADIAANLQLGLAGISANENVALSTNQVLGLAQYASIFDNATALLKQGKTSAVGGSFSMNGQTFDFSTYKLSNNPKLNTELYKSGVIGNASPVQQYSGLSYTSAPSSVSGGLPATRVAPVTSGVARQQSSGLGQLSVFSAAAIPRKSIPLVKSSGPMGRGNSSLVALA